MCLDLPSNDIPADVNVLHIPSAMAESILSHQEKYEIWLEKNSHQTGTFNPQKLLEEYVVFCKIPLYKSYRLITF